MTAKRTKSDLSRVKSLRNLRQVKEFLALSWRDLAARIPKRGGGHYSHGELMAWADGTRTMADEQFVDVCRLIARKLTARYGREIGVKAWRNSPWKIQPWVICERCGKEAELKQWNQKCRCKR